MSTSELRWSALALLLSLAQPCTAGEPSAMQIVRTSTELDRIEAWSGKVEVIDSQDDKVSRTRTGEIHTRLTDAQGEAQRNYLLTGPRDIKGTALLIHEHGQQAEDDFWLYLPSLGKVRRVAGSSKKSSFVGTQYALVDLQSFEYERYEHRLLGSEACEEGSCWLIESVPTGGYAEEIGYSKLHSWVLKDSFHTVKVEYFDLAGAAYKQQILKDFVAPADAAGGKAIATNRIMKNARTGTITTMKVQQLDFNPSFARDEFSPTGLNR